jgi:hypothetical protein
MKNQILGKDKNPEEKEQKKDKNKKRNKNDFTFRLSKQCIVLSMICNGSFYCLSP